MFSFLGAIIIFHIVSVSHSSISCLGEHYQTGVDNSKKADSCFTRQFVVYKFIGRDKEQCSCEDGYYFHLGQCISEKECERVTGFKQLNSCGTLNCSKIDKNSHFSKCASSTHRTCEIPNPEGFNEDCNRGCYCNKGYVLHKSGKCVKLANCNSTNACQMPNSVFKKCGSQLPPTCKNKIPVKTDVCIEGCFCKDRFFLHDLKCVSEEECNVLLNQVCLEPNTEFSPCGSATPPSCTNKYPATSPNCTEGCFCKQGYFFHENKCVPESFCDDIIAKNLECQRFDPNSQYKCSKIQERTCENKNPKINGTSCTDGCFCNEGYYKHKNGFCVDLKEC